MILLGIVFALVGACTPQRDYVRTGDTRGALVALSPASLGRDLTASQLVTGELLGEGKSVRFELAVNTDELVLVALTPTGVPLFSAKQVSHDIVFDHMSGETSALSPEFLIADIKFSYWPIATLNLAMGPFRSRVIEDEVEGRRHRVLLDELGQRVVEARYPPSGAQTGELVLRRFDVPYRLRIQSLSTLEGAGT
jgi:hypothetical protein